MTKSSTEGSHFVIAKCPDFIEEHLQLTLTKESKELFALGSAGQGYIGLVEIDTGIVHLMPSFNKEDGLLRCDKNGNPFTRAVSTEQTLGSGAGDLHMRTASTLKLGHKGGNAGLLMGFGLWKSGAGIKFLSELPDSKLRLIPNEYLLVKDSYNQWSLHYVDNNRKVVAMEITKITGLQEALDKLPPTKKAEELSFNERELIQKLLSQPVVPGVKFVKNRSSSQNMFSCQYTSAYGAYFHNSIGLTLGDQQQRIAHQVALKRELPLPVFQKIMDTVARDLEIPLLEKLENNPIVPTDRNDNHLRFHLQIEARWIDSLKILENANLLTDENRRLLSLAQDEPDTVASALSDLAKEGCLTSKTKTLLIQYLEYVNKLSKKVDLTSEESNEVECLRHTIPSLSEAFIYLEKEDLLTDAAWQLLKNNPFYASQIGQALCILKKSGLSKELALSLIQSPDDAIEISSLDKLLKFNVLNETNIKLFKAQANNISILESILSNLASAGILTDKTGLFLAQNGEKGRLIGEAIYKLQEANLLNSKTFELFMQVELTTANVNNIEQIINTKLQSSDRIHQLKEIIYRTLDKLPSHHARLFANVTKYDVIEAALSRLAKATPNISSTAMLDWKEGESPSLREIISDLISDKNTALQALHQSVAEIDEQQPAFKL